MSDPEQQGSDSQAPITRIDALRWSGESNEVFAQILLGLAAMPPEENTIAPPDTVM